MTLYFERRINKNALLHTWGSIGSSAGFLESITTLIIFYVLFCYFIFQPYELLEGFVNYHMRIKGNKLLEKHVAEKVATYRLLEMERENAALRQFIHTAGKKLEYLLEREVCGLVSV